MHTTGRLTESLPPYLRRRLYGLTIGEHHTDDLRIQTEIDRAFVVMLVACGLCERSAAGGLLREIERLAAADFRPLWNREIPRGVYLELERYLADRPEGAFAAELQRGRSRNDVTATATKIRLRQPLLKAMAGILRLSATCIRRAADRTPMILHTHLQPAQPGTVGFYFAGVASELLDDFDRFASFWPVLQRCPLGAGAITGTTLPLDERLVARLLGFDTPVENALQAIASRGYVLDALSAAATTGVTLSRIATDMLLWVSDEYRVARLPDSLVGSSSHLPQKRNPFILEHVQGRGARPTGAFVAASAAMIGHPFTNSVAVNTDAIQPLWEALADLDDCLLFLRACAEGLCFNVEAMEKQARSSACIAAHLAELARNRNLNFRQAHHEIGTLATLAERAGRPFGEVATEWALAQGLIQNASDLAPAKLVRGRNHGGGPGEESMTRQCCELEGRWHDAFAWWRGKRSSYRHATWALKAAVTELSGGAFPL